MNLLDYNQRLLDDLTAELSRPTAAIKATDYHVAESLELPNGWDLEVGYVWGRESVEDAPWVQVVEATLCTPARRIPLRVPEIARFVGEVEDELVEIIEAREQTIAEERHPSSCRCRDCRDEIGDREYHYRKENR